MMMMSRRVVLVAFMTFVCLCGLEAQGFLKKDIPTYEFIVDSLNTIQYPSSDTMRRERFFSKLDSVVLCQKGSVNIIHIGGSHVQADVFSNEVRRSLDSVNCSFLPGRGVIFPYEVAKTNNPRNYKVTHKGKWVASKNIRKNRTAKLGMNGMAVTTKDLKAEIKIRLNPRDSLNRWHFNRLRLLGYADSCTVVPLLQESDSTFIEAEYDSISSSYLFTLKESTDSFTVKIQQRDSIARNFTITGFIPENDEPGVIYHSIGVNGASVHSYLTCENFERDLNLIHPDLVIFGIGINDAIPTNFSDSTFIANYDSLISIVERVSPECFYIFITNNDSYRKIKKYRKAYYKVNNNALIVQKAFFTLAEKHKGGVWDFFELMGGLGSMKRWEESGLAQSDKVHFTHKGYILIGDLFFNALMKSYLGKD